MNKQLGLPRSVDIRQAMAAADFEELDQAARALGQAAIAEALEDAPIAPARGPDLDEERQRLLDAALADAIEVTARHRLRLGRRVCSRPDATTTRRVFELLRAMADATGGADSDPSFQ